MSKHFDISTNDEGVAIATFVSDGVLVSIPETHPNYLRIADALVKGEDPEALLDLSAAFKALEGKVTVGDDGLVKYSGEVIGGKVVDAIKRYQREGRDFEGLRRFLERLQLNPSRHAREQLYTWLERQELSVTPDGRFLAFKGVNDAPTNTEWVEDPGDDELGDYVVTGYNFSTDLDGTTWDSESTVYASSSKGTAFVDGVKFEGVIPNFVGATVTMDRRDVDDDFSQDCSYGLHVGSFKYASTFATHLLEVAVAPEDVVSVPKYDTNKLRTCRYEVLAVQEKKSPDISHHEAPAVAEEESIETLADAGVPRTWLQRLISRRRAGADVEEG